MTELSLTNLDLVSLGASVLNAARIDGSVAVATAVFCWAADCIMDRPEGLPIEKAAADAQAFLQANGYQVIEADLIQHVAAVENLSTERTSAS
ncbi:hypothetical protein [Thalassospira povalilytica]|uniref:hypothetical protein n=1 Tax=Thalassospira povalilytica TaxID=732237 RepID=UPI001D1953E7|nr:hypothetical protein [Thalassospira povalilytica]MCC4240925.1 hypothetical protein [Thalassospira povalilytica]